MDTLWVQAGQRMDGFGLMDYSARYYSSTLGRFVSPDTIIPQPGNPMAWDRYSYSINNPVNYTDPDGHCPLLVTALIEAGVAAFVDFGFQVYDDLQKGEAISVDVAEIAGAAVGGAIAGGTLGLGTAALTAVGGASAAIGLTAVPVAALTGGIGNALGGQIGALTEAGVRQIENGNFDKTTFFLMQLMQVS